MTQQFSNRVTSFSLRVSFPLFSLPSSFASRARQSPRACFFDAFLKGLG
jgi:hypothetical protein